MGTWGTGIRQNDYTGDIQDAFKIHLKAKKSVAEASELLIESEQNTLNDPDEEPLFWLALLDMQWTYGGTVDAGALAAAKANFETDAGMAVWQTDSAEIYTQRKQAIAEFLTKISIPNPKPKKPPKITVRKPKFKPGDCLSVKLKDGRYAAAFVSATDHSNIEYGKDLAVTLDYLSDSPPTLDVFKRRRWLFISHHNWNNQLDALWHTSAGFRKVKQRLTLVGNIEPLPEDPKDSTLYGAWEDLCQQVVYQHEWNAEHE